MTEEAAINYYEEDATRQILVRIASVFNDPDICDVVFIVGDGDDREEICAPSQFMAIASPYFKAMFYPPSPDGNNRKEIREVQPAVFRKVLDYLFRGRVPLASVEDAWRVKAAGKQFGLMQLDELCTKFLKYRLDASNLIGFLKAATKYEAHDLREVVIQRFTREANAVLAQDAMLDLNQEELMCLLETQPSVQASKLMDVLIKWAKKRYGLDVSTPPPEKRTRVENGGGGDAGGENGEAIANGGSGAADAMETGEEAPPQPDVNLIKPLQPFVKFLSWERADAEFYLKNVRNRKIMSEEDENAAMAQILTSFVEAQQPVRVTLTRGGRPKKGRTSGTLGPSSGPDCMVVMEKLSDKPGGGGYVKMERSFN